MYLDLDTYSEMMLELPVASVENLSAVGENKTAIGKISSVNNYWCERLKREFGVGPVPNAQGLYFILLSAFGNRQAPLGDPLKPCMRIGLKSYCDAVIDSRKTHPLDVLVCAIQTPNTDLFKYYFNLFQRLNDEQKILLTRETLREDRNDALEMILSFDETSRLYKKVLRNVIMPAVIKRPWIVIRSKALDGLGDDLCLYYADLLRYRPKLAAKRAEDIAHFLSANKCRVDIVRGITDALIDVSVKVGYHYILLSMFALILNDVELFGTAVGKLERDDHLDSKSDILRKMLLKKTVKSDTKFLEAYVDNGGEIGWWEFFEAALHNKLIMDLLYDGKYADRYSEGSYERDCLIDNLINGSQISLAEMDLFFETRVGKSLSPIILLMTIESNSRSADELIIRVEKYRIDNKTIEEFLEHMGEPNDEKIQALKSLVE